MTGDGETMKKFRKQNGFTLVEILIAMAVFGLIISISFGAIMASMAISRKADSMRQVQEESRDVMDFIRKDIKKSDVTNLEINTDGIRFVVTHTNTSVDEYHCFQLDSNKLMYGSSAIPGCAGTPLDLTSPNVLVKKMVDGNAIFRTNLPSGMAASNYVVIDNLKFVSAKGGAHPYEFEIATTIAK
jgi:prepilin-type N-terminal cleavage/methylation domain-containing protein